MYTGKKLSFDVVSGLNHTSRPVTDYALIVQCGGCMITRKQLVNRLRPALEAGIPVTNYGMAIAWMQGVYERTVMSLARGWTMTIDNLLQKKNLLPRGSCIPPRYAGCRKNTVVRTLSKNKGTICRQQGLLPGTH